MSRYPGTLPFYCSFAFSFSFLGCLILSFSFIFALGGIKQLYYNLQATRKLEAQLKTGRQLTRDEYLFMNATKADLMVKERKDKKIKEKTWKTKNKGNEDKKQAVFFKTPGLGQRRETRSSFLFFLFFFFF